MHCLRPLAFQVIFWWSWQYSWKDNCTRLRYFLLANPAVSDFLCLILVNSFRIASIAEESWLYGQTMCHLNSCFHRYFYVNTILHLLAVSYDRYKAIVNSPLTYDDTMTSPKMLLVLLIWLTPTQRLGKNLWHLKPSFYCRPCFQYPWKVEAI